MAYIQQTIIMEWFQMLRYNEAGEAYVVEKRRVKGVFLENLELKDFPFDVQVSIDNIHIIENLPGTRFF